MLALRYVSLWLIVQMIAEPHQLSALSFGKALIHSAGRLKKMVS